ncbi:MAG: glycosyltransferase family 2 protein [Candidatus Micrarchaeota archaeon]
MRLCVLLPTFNEAESIGQIIDRVKKLEGGYRVCVVDGGSSDGTVDIAKGKGAAIISINKRGKATAIRKAFSDIEDDIAVILDSDASYAPEEIPLFIRALESCDVVVGSRFRGRIAGGSMPFLNRLGNRALTAMANALYGKRISDVCSGFWAFRKRAYKAIEVNSKHFELEANFYAECAKKGIGICEVPITYGARRGKTKLSVLHGFEIGAYLALRRFF